MAGSQGRFKVIFSVMGYDDNRDPKLLVETKEGAMLSDGVETCVSCYLVREYAIGYHLLHAEIQ